MDAAYRWIFGIMLMVFALLLDAALGWKLAVFALGAAGAVTALRGYCPFNAFVGIDTHTERRKSALRLP
jgi:hypothetical protein